MSDIEVTYREATEDDIDRIVQIARQIWHIGRNKAMEDRHGEIGGRPWQDHIAASMRSAMEKRLDANQAIVGEVDGNVAGWGTWSLDEKNGIGTVGYNGVDPQYRGHGIGTEIVRRVLNHIREAGMKIAAVSTGLNEGHAAARHVYEKLGFEPLRKSVYYTQEL
ncbi:MAG: GNAT family N-acetyltransferase [Armatimonadota bacterium]